jgi:hypothetical protein
MQQRAAAMMATWNAARLGDEGDSGSGDVELVEEWGGLNFELMAMFLRVDKST